MEPTFTKQTYSQLLKIKEEFGLDWPFQDRNYIETHISTTAKFDVYVVGSEMFVEVSK